ncbi:hypothetical protein CBER1_07855 [Cercospora berteroae]|uniref:Uncharacterized protein n=1 Tax=Cercospora berteroae TaxID=357750 RepID=A0A2S6C534_9PEZI|nr:hypothetical protein CBER1_07855 [Cercospora berteroae]
MLRALTCVALAGSMLVGATPITVTVPGGAPYPASIPCIREKRLQIATNIIEAFNDPDPPDGCIDFCINGAPCLRLSPGAQGAKNIANGARQAVANVVTEYTAFDNGTTIMDAVVTFGVGALGVPVPVETDIYVDGLIDTQDCQIIGLPTYLTVPTEVLGMPVRPPILPNLGIGTIPPVTLPF